MRRYLHGASLRDVIHREPRRLLGRKASHELFDLSLRLAGGLRQHRLLIRLGEVRRQQAQTCQVHPPRARSLQDGGQPAAGARHHDAVVRGRLGEPELSHAEREHRRMRALEIQLPLVDLPEMDEKIRLQQLRLPHQLPCRREQRLAAQRLDPRHPHHAICHDRSVPTPSDKTGRRPGHSWSAARAQLVGGPGTAGRPGNWSARTSALTNGLRGCDVAVGSAPTARSARR